MPDSKHTTAQRRPAQKKWRRRLGYALVFVVVALVAGELVCRFYLGLGDPPLSRTHATIEYVLAPNQSVRQFGNRFETNSFSMRSAEFPSKKTNLRELRVLVFGDSIINGGALTDQDDLATELLRRDLAELLGRPVVVGNISAGTWGPANLLAYVEQFGTFDADIAVVVLSSHDAADAPTFEPLDPATHPERRPASALWEAMTRYVPRYLPSLSNTTPSTAHGKPSDKEMRETLDALQELLATLQRSGAKTFVLMHPTQAELAGDPLEGWEQIKGVCRDAQVEVVELGPRYEATLDRGENPYRDDGLHPNNAGQRAIFAALREVALDVVTSSGF